jgi:hypothetical protein
VLNRPGTSRFRDDGPLVRLVLSRAGLPQPLLFALVAALGAAAAVAIRTEAALVAAGVLALGAGLPARDKHAGPLDWLVPAALRAAEYLLVVAVALTYDVPLPVCYLLLFALALRHYDVTARMEKGAPGSPADGALLGWDGRVVLLLVAALTGVPTLGEAVLVGTVGGALLIEAGLDWRTRSS